MTTTTQKNWDDWYAELVVYHKTHGHCNVSTTDDDKKYAKLGGWVERQRQRHPSSLDLYTSPLEQDQINRLDAIDFVWSDGCAKERQWNDMFERLKRYRVQYGNCLVPVTYKEGPSLGMWVCEQRRVFKSGTMDLCRVEQLNSIGFSWDDLQCGTNTHKWNVMFERLKRYKQDYGDCLVTRNYKEDPSLGVWVRKQRMSLRCGTMDRCQIEQLNSIGFCWDAWQSGSFTNKWNDMFKRLQQYKLEYGDCLVTPSYKADPSLAMWVNRQRMSFRRGTMDLCRVEQLNSIGFCWDDWQSGTNTHKWNVMFERLKRYKQEYGDCLVTRNYKEDPSLGVWVRKQRMSLRCGTMDRCQIEQLNSIGFCWDAWQSGSFTNKWNDMFKRLQRYKLEYGDCLVTPSYKADPSLAMWVNRQRMSFRRGTMDLCRVEQLNSIGFCWDDWQSGSFTHKWNDMFKRLQQYKLECGDCSVAPSYKEDPSLAMWVRKQRVIFKGGTMDRCRVEQLNSIGFCWDAWQSGSFTNKWNDMFKRLQRYKLEYGDCLVTPSYKADPSLAMWVNRQRMSFRRGTMDLCRVEQLNSIGFCWDDWQSGSFTHKWNDMFKRLQQYKLECGDCSVAPSYKEDPSLAMWVRKQRVIFKGGTMDRCRVEQLNSIGFCWDAWQSGSFTNKWNDMFKRLQRYKLEYGDCLVTPSYKADPSLAMWVNRQRMSFRRGTMDLCRVEQLNSIGFCWDDWQSGSFTNKWNDMFKRLQRYKLEYGDCLVTPSYKADPSLAMWVNRQRMSFRRGTMDLCRVEQLNSIGFCWDDWQSGSFTHKWNDMFKRLQQYKLECGDCSVAPSYKEDPSLAMWVRKQRVIFKGGTMDRCRVEQLNSIGFCWDAWQSGSFTNKWNDMFKRLQRYKLEYGDCLVTPSYKADPSLAMWVNRQRMSFRRGTMDLCRVEQLNSIGFCWDDWQSGSFTHKWNDMFKRLQQYKLECGDCSVAPSYKEDPSLAMWVRKQRVIFKGGTMDLCRVEQLNSIGFCWDDWQSGSFTHKWNDMFKRLQQYKLECGDCSVAPSYKEDPSLAMWVRKQRVIFKGGTMDLCRVEQLNSIGFCWDDWQSGSFTHKWNDMFKRLQQYKLECGDCSVAPSYKEDPSLAMWVRKQRVIFKGGTMDRCRVEQLNSIGFCWEASRNSGTAAPD